MAASMPIAIVGMSCRFPGGAESPEDFWNLLQTGWSSWSKIPEDRFNAKAFYNPDPDIRGTFNCEGAHFLNSDVRKFDAQFFGINPKEAATMDPQQRLQLECAYEALESGGRCVSDLAGSDTAVFVSIFNKDYDRMLFRDPDNIPTYHMVGNGEAILANRISHFFDLRGPSVTLDTGCSGGLVALHLACQSIRTGESKQAIVGGTNLILAPDIMASLSQIRFFSPQGRCYSHDERAAGYGRGEGAAALLIKPLRDALQDGDPIRAVIRSTAVNQDGRTQGITLPSKDAQIALIRSTYNNAGLDLSRTAYCEAHGTGTAVGDPIEAEAISTVFDSTCSSDVPLYLGSVKTNIGHLESASGLAGLIKSVLMLENAKIAPNHDFQKLNPRIGTSGRSLKIPKLLLDWPVSGVRQVSVNSFGYGGTNCHAVLDNSQEFSNHTTRSQRLASTATSPNATRNSTHEYGEARYSIVLSGKSAQACLAQRAALKLYLETKGSQVPVEFLSSLSYTLCSRRSPFSWRWATSATSIGELRGLLDQSLSPPKRIKLQPRIGFVFTGQGSQWHAMGRELINHNAIFTASLRRGDACIKMLGASWSVMDELSLDAVQSRVTAANIGQPLVTALQLALVDLLQSWDITPSSVVGHSSGEIAAAYAAGILSYESAIAIAYWRGEHASRVKSNGPRQSGSMMAVPLSESEAEQHISRDPAWKDKIVVACSNSPSSVTLSGDTTAIMEIQKHFEARAVSARLLKVDTAYHSHHMQGISSDYLSSIEKEVPIATARRDTSFFSSVTATELCWSEIRPSYWVQNLVSKVRFHQALQEMCRLDSGEQSLDIILEIGPHAALATPIKQTVQISELANTDVTYLPSLKRNENAVLSIHRLASELWSLGCAIDLALLQAPGLPTPPKPLTDLPRYQWDRSLDHWSEPRMSKEYRNRPYPRHELLGNRSIDFDPILPKWRNSIRLSEVPWLRDHVIEGRIIYPAAGFLAMAMEAVRQTVMDRFGSVMVLHSIGFRDVTIERALILHDDSDGIEVLTTLQPVEDNIKEDSSTTRYTFRIRSIDQQEEFVDHCRGSVVVNARPQQQTQINGTAKMNGIAKEILPDRSDANRRQIEKEAIYEDFLSRNIQYRGNFATVTRIFREGDSAVAIVDPPACVRSQSCHPTASTFVHSTVLDGCFQVLVALLLGSKHIRRPPLLNFIRVLDFHDIGMMSTGDQLQLDAQICSAGSQASNGKFEAWSSENPTERYPLISGTGIRITASGSSESNRAIKRPYLYQDEHIPDIELLDPLMCNDICRVEISEPKKSVDEELEAFEMLSLYFVQRAFYELGSDPCLAREPEQLQHLWNWMKSFIEQNSKSTHPDYAAWNEVDVEQSVQKVQRFGDEGKMLVRMGYNLPAILSGSAQPLPLMLEDDLLSSFYHNDSLRRCYTQMGKYLQLLGLKNPNLKILEIGAGTGGTTVSVLQALSRPRAEDGFMFHAYDFTDISSGFFDKAQSLLKRWKGSVNYKRLDIEKRPSTQGFTPGHYDLVLASNVLHATSDIEKTIGNVRELLKPGGKFVLLEITRLQAHLNVSFGGLPGWWAGVPDGRVSSPLMTQDQWGRVLQRHRFSDFDVCLSDYEGEARRTEVLVSTAVDLEANKTNLGLTICVNNSDAVALSIAQSLSGTFDAVDLVDLEDFSTSPPALHRRLCLFLGDMTGDFLASCSGSMISDLFQVFSTAAKTLWVTRRANQSMISPADGFITGLTRSWNLQKPSSAICTISLSTSTAIRQHIAVISMMVQEFLTTESTSLSDLEYTEDQGLIKISRLLIDGLATDRMISHLETRSPRAFNFQQGNEPLRIEQLSSGTETRITLANGTNTSGSLAKEEIEILPQYISLAAENGDDLFDNSEHALGVLRDCSGIVRRVGSSYGSRFMIGDRVCAIGSGPACNHFRVPADTVQLIPPQVSFEEASSIPIILVTALYSLKEIAKAQKAETILVYQAAQTFGQAVITLAQGMDLDVYASVDQASERTMLTERYGIPSTHVFHTDSAWTTEHHEKFDIIVGCWDQNSLKEAFCCLACFGTIICLGSIPRSIHSHQSEQPKVNCTVSVVNSDLLYHRKKSLFQRLASEVMVLVRKGEVKLPTLTNLVPLSADTLTQNMLRDSNTNNCFLETDCITDVQEKQEGDDTICPRRDTAYIIVGDGSGIEDIVCKWLGKREVEDIILLPQNIANDAVNAYPQKQSSTTDRPPNDSAPDTASLEEAINSVKRRGRALGGVFYIDFTGTGETDIDGPQQDVMSTAQQRSSKSNLQHLFDTLQGEELGLVTVVSSVCGLTGAADIGKATTSSHHSNLIARSWQREYPVLSLDLGIITQSDSGPVVLSPDIQSHAFEQNIFAVLDSVLDTKLSNGTVTHMVVDLTLEDVVDGKQPVSQDPRFLHTGSQKSSSQPAPKDEPQSLERELQTCHDLESSTAILCTALAKRLGKLLACPPEDFSPASSIAQFGIDSLVAAELRAWIFQNLKSPIKIEEILGRDTMFEIAKKIAQRSALVRDNLMMKTSSAVPGMVREQTMAADGTGEDSAGVDMERSDNETRHTLYHQDSLPKMPVPSLQTTLKEYVSSIRPLLTDAEYSASKKRVENFGKEGGMGEVLQERLEARTKDPEIKNWLYEYWVTHYYLNPRKPIAPATNFFMAHEDTVIKHSMAKRAAIITKAVIEFKNDWDQGTLEPAMLHDAPICMESYHWLFNTCRIPKMGGDQSRKADTSNHITVVWRSSFYRLEAEQNGRNLDLGELESLFWQIIEGNAACTEAGFGLLTTEDRDVWAQARTRIKGFHPENAASIDSIESSAFLICLDEQESRTSEERAHQFWHGNGSNRYSDKPLQFIVTPSGSGFNGEHSRLDGSPTIRLNKHVNKHLLESADDEDFSKADGAVGPSSSSDLLLPTKLPIHLDTETLTTIDSAQARFNKAVTDCQLSILYYDGFGETFLRKMGCHPSTTLQMVFQLATYRFYGKPIPTFEPVGNFRFKQGRYDAVRSLSVETAAFCASMTKKKTDTAPPAGPAEQIKRLRTAMSAHIKRVRDLSYGASIDNHMFGLWMSLRSGEDETPAIFTDPIFRYSTDWFFSTSYMPADAMEYGFGPDVDDGWSVQYPIWPDMIMFCITTKTFRAKEMGDEIRKAADDIKALLLLQQQHMIKSTAESKLAN